MSREDRKLLLKLIVIGNSGVGKTAILHQYVNNTFIDDHKATIGADFLTKEMRIGNKDITIQIWDTAGQERFLSLGTAFYRGADACILCFDVTNKQSFDKIEEWRRNFLEHCDPNDPDDFPFILIGNKIDQSDERVVQSNEGKSKADQLNMQYHETSALNGTGIDRAMKELISQASESPSVPFFTKDVQVKIEREQDGEEPETPQQPCPCSLL